VPNLPLECGRHAVFSSTRWALNVAKYSTGCGLRPQKQQDSGHFAGPSLWIKGALNDILVIHHLGVPKRRLH
jgi:hypothetical protein